MVKENLKDAIQHNDSKYNLYFAMIFEKEELDHGAAYFVLTILCR